MTSSLPRKCSTTELQQHFFTEVVQKYIRILKRPNKNAFFRDKIFPGPLSAPFDGHRRCCDPAYGGPASRANNTGCLYLMYHMMCNMCARPPRSAPLSCCPAAAGVLGAAAGCPIVGRGPVAGRRTSLLRDDFVRRLARHSFGSGSLAMRWVRRRGPRLSAEARLQGGGRRFCGTISCGGSPGIRPAVAAWRCVSCVTSVLSVCLHYCSRRAAGLVGWDAGRAR